MAEYYELKPGYIFFEGNKFGTPPIEHPERGKYPIKPQIIDQNAGQTYKLNDSAAFITRLLLTDVDTDLLSQIFASRTNKTPSQALTEIQTFIDDSGFFDPKDKPGNLPPTLKPTPSNFEKIWADFSIGSAYFVSATLKPI